MVGGLHLIFLGIIMTITIFYIPVPNEEAGKNIGSVLIQKKLAACTNLFPIQSCYFWENAICNDNELVLIAKTLPHLSESLEQEITAIHPYTVPCILHWEAKVNATYFEWMKEQVS